MDPKHFEQPLPSKPNEEESKAIKALTDEQREMAGFLLEKSGLQRFAYVLISPPEEPEGSRREGHSNEQPVSVLRTLATCTHFWDMPPSLVSEGIMLKLESQVQEQGS